MPRRARSIVGGMVYHVLNRAVRRERLFKRDADYEAFERVLEEAHDREPIRILSYCLMPNHWHMVVWPQLGKDDQASEFMRWLTLTHAQRWHAHFKTTGTGPVYQGRFKAFPVQDGRHLWTVLRYVERNPLRANLVRRAEDWKWSSLWRWSNDGQHGEPLLSPLPDSAGRRPRNWIHLVNQPHTERELAQIRQCVARGRPFGQPQWARRQVKRLGLEATIRAPGRPRKVRR